MIWFGYIILGVLLFILNVYCKEKYKFNKKDNFIFSIIFMLVVAGVCSRSGLDKFNENIFIILVCELFCQLIYISYFLEKDFFNKEDNYCTFYIVKIVSCFLLNQELINKVDDVFLTGDNLKLVVWLLIIVYVYKFFKIKDNDSIKKDINVSKDRIAVAFAKLKIMYGDDISVSNDDEKLVIYAIMIFNNFLRPKVFRRVDNLLFKLNNKPRKLGIMQVMSKKYINDYESIVTVCKKIDKLWCKNGKAIDIINSYDKDNSKDIGYIYNYLKEFCKL